MQARRSRNAKLAALSTVAFAVVAACSQSSDDSLADIPRASPAPGDDSNRTGGPGMGGGINSGIPQGAAGLPPEKEEEATFRVPVVSGHWVWTANPQTGRVAVIDATKRTVSTIEAGF